MVTGLPPVSTGAGASLAMIANYAAAGIANQGIAGQQSFNSVIGNPFPKIRKVGDGIFSERRDFEKVGFAIDFTRTLKFFGNSKYKPWVIKIAFGKSKEITEWQTTEESSPKMHPEGFIFERNIAENERVGWYSKPSIGGRLTASHSLGYKRSGRFRLFTPYARGGKGVFMKFEYKGRMENGMRGANYKFRLQKKVTKQVWHPWGIKISFSG